MGFIFKIQPYQTDEAKSVLLHQSFLLEIFKTLEHVVDRLCETICRLTNETVRSISARQGISVKFLIGSSITLNLEAV